MLNFYLQTRIWCTEQNHTINKANEMIPYLQSTIENLKQYIIDDRSQLYQQSDYTFSSFCKLSKLRRIFEPTAFVVFNNKCI